MFDKLKFFRVKLNNGRNLNQVVVYFYIRRLGGLKNCLVGEKGGFSTNSFMA